MERVPGAKPESVLIDKSRRRSEMCTRYWGHLKLSATQFVEHCECGRAPPKIDLAHAQFERQGG